MQWLLRRSGLWGAVVLYGVFLASLCWTARVTVLWHWAALQLDPGELVIHWGDWAWSEWVYRISNVPRVAWRPWYDSGVNSITVGIPLWMPMVLGLSLSGAAWWRWSRRVPPGHCPVCRYDRSGLPVAASCPECAAGPDAATPAASHRSARRLPHVDDER